MNRLPDERDMDQAVRSWMRDDEQHAADRNRQVGRIMGRIDETHQRRGAWRFLPFGRGKRRIDEDDDGLLVGGGSAVGVRRGVSSAMAVAAVAVLMILGVTFLAVVPRTTEPGAGGPSPSPLPTVHPDDAALMAAFAGVWSGERTTQEDVLEVYSQDAVHTVLWHDKVERFDGPSAIWRQIQRSRKFDPIGWIPLPDGPGIMPDERRYMSVSGNLGGIACVATLRDRLVRRHDCILPMATTDPVPEWDVTPADTLDVRAQLWPRFLPGFADANPELIAATVSPDIVHHVAFMGRESMVVGIEDYVRVMGLGGVEELLEPILLPAPEGEHRWTDYSDLAGGTLCTFWERDGLIVRHDCLVPST